MQTISRDDRIPQQKSLRHIVDGDVKADVLRLEVSLSRLQLGRAIGDELLEIAGFGVDFLDHQGHRAVRAPPIAVEFVIGAADQRRKLSDINRARRVGRLGDLLGDQTMHD